VLARVVVQDEYVEQYWLVVAAPSDADGFFSDAGRIRNAQARNPSNRKKSMVMSCRLLCVPIHRLLRALARKIQTATTSSCTSILESFLLIG